MTQSALLARFHQVSRRYAQRVAVVDGRGEASFEEIHDSAERLARRLCGLNLAGRRVALLAPTSRDWVVAFWGILLSGASLVPLAVVHPDAEHERALRASGAVALLRGVGLGAGLASGGAPDEPRVLELAELLAGAERSRDNPPSGARGADTAVVFFTSGTTGAPKRARLSHDQLAHMARLVGSDWRIDAGDRLVHCLPLHHMHGLGIAYLVCQQAGASVHLLGSFEIGAVWEALAHGTVFMAVPTIHKKLLDGYREAPPELQQRWRRGAQGLRLITSGSAALPRLVAEGWAELTGRIPLERFGMTEVGVALSNPLEGNRIVGSAGRPLPGMQVRIVDERGADVEPGRPGEIWIRGPSVFSGYDDPEQTRASYSADGWFKSGDTATWLDHGFVKILGRSSIDIIKSGGYKLSALEIEEALREHPNVNDAAVLGVPDVTWGECVVAAVIVSRDVTEAELREFLKLRLAPYKVPKKFLKLSDLPRNVMGKVDKQKLKAYVAEAFEDEATTA